MKTLTQLTARLWRSDAALTATGLLMLGALAGSAAGLWFDPRLVTGAPAWLKPAKFAASIAIYAFTVAWIFTYLPDWRRVRRLVGWTTAVVLVLELVIIDIQAWRGTISHFNLATPLDATLFGVMGAGITLQTAMTVLLAVAVWRQPFTDRALGWAVRLGVSLAIIGASTGGLMTTPTRAQMTDLRAGHPPAIVGAHTVGAPDGGPGLPAVGWSREHGDLRVPHFLGLHALQMLPLFALVLKASRSTETVRVRLVLTAGASLAALFGILLWQALRGQSPVHPDSPTLIALALWATLSAGVGWFLAATSDAKPAQAVTC